MLKQGSCGSSLPPPKGIHSESSDSSYKIGNEKYLWKDIIVYHSGALKKYIDVTDILVY